MAFYIFKHEMVKKSRYLKSGFEDVQEQKIHTWSNRPNVSRKIEKTFRLY